MFERFTEEARRVVVLAQEQARTLDHNYIGTEHLLLGLLANPDGTAAPVLAAHGVGADAVREQVVSVVGRGTDPPSDPVPFTERAKKVLELSLDEARDHDSIGTEHLLLALIREGEGDGQGVAVRALVNLGVDLDALGRAAQDTTADEAQTGGAPPPVAPTELLRSEVVRLRQLLTQHEIDPDDTPDPAS